MKALLKLVYGIKVNLAIQEQQLITLYQVRQRKQLRLEQRAGKSGLPNFKDADAVNQVIKQGRASGPHLDILFNNLLKPDKREEFVKQFNKYGWSLAAPAIINNRE